jgi:hypothetical protein
MTRRSHLAAWLVLWLAGLVAWPAWVGSQGMAERTREDMTSLAHTFGPRLTAMLLKVAATGQRPFGQHGVDDLLEANAPPGARSLPAIAGKPVRGLAEQVVVHADLYLVALRLQVHGAVLRAAVLLAWVILLAPMAVAAVIDGGAERAIRGDTFGSQSPAAFALAGHAFIVGAMLPVMALVLPFGLPHGWIPVWLLGVLLPLRVAIAHMQPIFTR